MKRRDSRRQKEGCAPVFEELVEMEIPYPLMKNWILFGGASPQILQTLDAFSFFYFVFPLQLPGPKQGPVPRHRLQDPLSDWEIQVRSPGPRGWCRRWAAGVSEVLHGATDQEEGPPLGEDGAGDAEIRVRLPQRTPPSPQKHGLFGWTGQLVVGPPRRTGRGALCLFLVDLFV